MDSRAREIVKIGNKMFGDKRIVDSLWQEIALNFYPERADFTTERSRGEEFADHLFSSYPVMARRELANMMSEFIRPDKFFEMHVDDDELDEGDHERAFMERLTQIQWRAMSDPVAQLVRAEGQVDNDFVTFGNGVLYFGKNSAGDALLFKNYHLRDNAWSENAEGKVDCNHRNWKPTARQLHRLFPKTISGNVKRACGLDGDNGKDPEKTFDCRHVVLPSRLYDYTSKTGKKFPFTSLYVECESETVLEEVGLSHFCYVISRWQTIANSPYAVSMVTSVLLPDGRTLQVVMRTLREAGEMYVNPPMIQTKDAIRGDIALYPGGITTADASYDEKLGEVLRPLTLDKGGFPIGEKIADALKQDIRSGWMIDKIQLPQNTGGSKMTATEVRRQIQEQIRGSAPIVKPVQTERNHPLCDGVFQVLAENGAFPLDQMPDSLSGKDMKFKFRSPIDDLVEENEARGFVAGLTEVLLPAAQADPALMKIPNLEKGVRDSLRAYGWSAKWLNDEDVVQAERDRIDEEEQAHKLAAELGAAGQVAEQGGKGLDALVRGAMAARGDIAPQGNGRAPAARPRPVAPAR